MASIPPAELERLIAAARRVQRRAHAPYSRFHVGASILTDKGLIISGCNVENVSYGLTICAERNAIGQMVARNAGTPLDIVVVGDTEGPLTPCGACRQVLAEFNTRLRVHCLGKSGKIAHYDIADLLPASFDVQALESGR